MNKINQPAVKSMVKEEMAQHTQLPWIVRKNPMRDDGWFIDYAHPHEIPGANHADGTPCMHWQNVTYFQIATKEDAEFIVRACNSHDELLAASQLVLTAHEAHELSPLHFDALRAAIKKATPPQQDT